MANDEATKEISKALDSPEARESFTPEQISALKSGASLVEVFPELAALPLAPGEPSA